MTECGHPGSIQASIAMNAKYLHFYVEYRQAEVSSFVFSARKGSFPRRGGPALALSEMNGMWGGAGTGDVGNAFFRHTVLKTNN